MKKTFDYITAVEAVEGILTEAVALHASDIHIDPDGRGLNIRLRIDGHMEEVGTVNKRLHEELISRLKILANVRTDVHAVPQDGRWRAHIDDTPYNIRISFMPTYYGENAVLRLLPAASSVNFSFANLGFIPDQVYMINKALQRTNGLILVTGPTGSGKTTTLHTCLSMKTREPLSIITLEDPVEYEIPSVRQVHIKHDHGVTFATGLRSALRQDPDVIMVGEIRDAETARVAVHTALTGHLVLSTLHTNNAIEAIPRLIDMGVDPYLLASTLTLVVAQRLVRKICDACNALGCPDCRNIGYVGRSVIAEVCEIDQKMRDLISRKATTTSCTGYITSRGFRPLLEDGLEKVEWGVTSKAEVLRVLDSC